MIDGATGEQMDAVTRETMKLPKDIIEVAAARHAELA